MIARQQGRGLAEVATAAQADILGQRSLKAALDCDWEDPNARLMALQQVLGALEALEAYVRGLESLGAATGAPEVPTAAHECVAVAHEVVAQDVEQRADGVAVLRRGVARDRRISIEDGLMRHGRKSKHERVDGYKRHVVRDLDLEVVRAVGLTAANVPEATVTDDLLTDLEHQQAPVNEWSIDRAYLSSSLVRDRGPDVQIYCKAWPVRNGERFPKTAFQLDWAQQRMRCPNGVTIPFQPGGVVHFPTEACASCPLRTRCTTSKSGRSVAIHPDERLLAELRQRQQTAAGRAKLRERVAVEHSLAHIGRWQGERARYLGIRKNLFDLRRCAVVHNLHVIARLAEPEAA